MRRAVFLAGLVLLAAGPAMAKEPGGALRSVASDRGVAIAIGATVRGALASSDAQLDSGEYQDRYRFTARRGDRIEARLTSSEFDPYIILRRPDGTQADNDDARIGGQPSTNSLLNTALPQDGAYEILVTSYRPGERGRYQLSVARSAGTERQVNVQGGQRVFALLVGVSDYGERMRPLDNTDEDARALHASLQRAGVLNPASIVLTNAEASRASVRAAFERIARQAGPNDLFLFFFSGHGNQVDVQPSAAELDGRSETIELHDGALFDADLQRMMAGVRSRMALVVLDSCFSGGFKNLVDRPNVMGIFSSEEDMTSVVAERVKAGGFLSYFLRAGLAGEADEDGDRILTAGEMATYLRRRFRSEGDIPATTRDEDQRNFQNLVVERGGVHVDDVVFRIQPRLASAQALAPPQGEAEAKEEMEEEAWADDK